MNKRSFVISAVLLGYFVWAFVVVLPVDAQVETQVEKQPHTITTSGEAKIWIQPDRARVYLGVETMREVIDSAREENAVKVKSVIEALKSLGIKGMLMKAPAYNVSLVKEAEHEATRQGRLPKVIGYKVVQDFTVLLQNENADALSKDAGLVIDAALNNGVNSIQNVEFFKEDEIADKRSALMMAVKDAIANAEAIAKTAGLTIKGYSTINSQLSYWRPPVSNVQMMQRADFSGGMAGEATTLIAGKIAVTANVTISCLIE